MSTAGVIYRSIRAYWNFSPTSDFSGVTIFEVQNQSSVPAYALPRESLIWFSTPSEGDIKFRLVMRDGAPLHKLLNPQDYELEESASLEIGLKSPKEHVIAWRPKLFPPLGPAEIVAYEMEVVTPGTEGAAFTNEGSTLGIPIHHPTNSAQIVARAPAGYRFELLNPSFFLRAVGTGKELDKKDSPPPVLDGDGSVLIWNMEAPQIGARYIASYRFVKK